MIGKEVYREKWFQFLDRFLPSFDKEICQERWSMSGAVAGNKFHSRTRRVQRLIRERRAEDEKVWKLKAGKCWAHWYSSTDFVCTGKNVPYPSYEARTDLKQYNTCYKKQRKNLDNGIIRMKEMFVTHINSMTKILKKQKWINVISQDILTRLCQNSFIKTNCFKNHRHREQTCGCQVGEG